jgi:HEAT repeat protein
MIWLLAMLACGPSSEDIATNLHSPNPVVREDTAKIARNFGSDAVETALIDVLGDKESKVRLNAVESLVELECGLAVAPLMGRLEPETDPRVRRAIVDALGRLGDVQAVPTLITHLQDQIEDPQLNVIWALGTLADHRALDVLAGLRSSSDPYVVWNVNQALRNLRPAPGNAG